MNLPRLLANQGYCPPWSLARRVVQRKIRTIRNGLCMLYSTQEQHSTVGFWHRKRSTFLCIWDFSYVFVMYKYYIEGERVCVQIRVQILKCKSMAIVDINHGKTFPRGDYLKTQRGLTYLLLYAFFFMHLSAFLKCVGSRTINISSYFTLNTIFL